MFTLSWIVKLSVAEADPLQYHQEQDLRCAVEIVLFKPDFHSPISVISGDICAEENCLVEIYYPLIDDTAKGGLTKF